MFSALRIGFPNPLCLLLANVMVLIIASPASCQLPNPVLHRTVPIAGQAGTAFPLSVQGVDLDEADQLWFSHPGIQAEVVAQAAAEFETASRKSFGQFQVRIADNVTAGVYEVRTKTRWGLSTPRPFLVSSESVIFQPNSHRPDQALAIGINDCVLGQCENNQVDYYSFAAKKGQALVVECLAATLGSSAKPIITITSPDGRQLVRSRSASDNALSFTVPADGTYFIEVNDYVFAGGPGHYYRLKIHDGPYIDTILPPAAPPGKITKFTVWGRHWDNGQTDLSMLLADEPLQQKTFQLFVAGEHSYESTSPVVGPAALTSTMLEVPFAGGQNNAVRIFHSELPLQAESPDASRTNAQTVSVPVEVYGQFYPRRDSDWFQFPASKGTAYSLDVICQQLGVPADVAVLVEKVDSQGNAQQVATADDRQFDRARFNGPMPASLDYSNGDVSLQFTADADAVYRIGVRDLYSGARDDPRLVYRLQLQLRQPSFDLLAWSQRILNNNNQVAASPSSLVLRRGGTTMLQIDVIRHHGFQQPLRLEVTGLPSGVRANPVWIDGKQQRAIVVLQAAADVAAWNGSIEVTGTTLDGKQTKVAKAVTLTSDVGNVQAERPAARQMNDVMLSVVAEETAIMDFQVADNVYQTARGGRIEIPVQRIRNGEVKGDLTMVPAASPADIKLENVVFKPDADQATHVVLVESANAPLGDHSYCLAGQVAVRYERNPQAIASAQQQYDDFVQQMATWEQEKSMAEQQLEMLRQQRSQQASQGLAVADVDQLIGEAQKRLDDLAAKRERAEMFRQTLENRLNEVKKQNEPKDVQAVFATPNIHIRVHESPVTIALAPPELRMTAGQQAELSVTIERKFGFAGDVTLSVAADANSLVSGSPVTVTADQANGTLLLQAKPDAQGRQTVQVIAKQKFGNVESQTVQSIEIVFEP
ncbi:MAG: pre-peptidase C-terminal domain-containing protein [Planctomycetales bacterium]|nr:pre-peptidase C-terminal domain-containing protein [Planctomycetales bacterium]